MSQSRSLELNRVACALELRGFLLLVVAFVAVRWPEQTLLPAIVAGGAMTAALGVFELASAWFSRSLPSSRYFYVGHALVFLGFGALAAVAPLVSLPTAINLVLAWLVAYALYCLLLAGRLWYSSPEHQALLASAAVNLAFAFVVARFRAPSLVALMYWGLLYVGLLGLAQLAAGVWIVRHLLTPTGRDAVAARAGAAHVMER